MLEYIIFYIFLPPFSSVSTVNSTADVRVLGGYFDGNGFQTVKICSGKKGKSRMIMKRKFKQ